MIAISVIMPVYNTKTDFLRRAIQSVLKQSLRNIELLLVDDGSTNGAASICDQYAKIDTRVKVIHQENQGICVARNNGIKNARGEYITFIDHDDEYGVNQLLDNYELGKRNQADVVKFGYEYICLDDAPTFPFSQYIGDKVEVFDKEALRQKYADLKDSGILTFVWDALFRKDFLLEHNFNFDLRFKIGQEDIAFCNLIYQDIEMMVYNPKKYYCHYRYVKSTSRGMQLDKVTRLLDDEQYVFRLEQDLYEHLYPETNLPIWNDILVRNMLVFLASVMRQDANISWSERYRLLSKTRKDFPIDEKIKLKYIDKLTNKVSMFLYKQKHIYLLMLGTKVYVAYLNLKNRCMR